MALNTEIILTLQQLKGFGTKTIINISKTEKDISTIEKLCLFWKTLKGKRFESISSEDLHSANKAALRVLDACQRENIGIISYDEPLFPTMLRNCINEEGKGDPAILLYYRGNIDALQKPGIAVIGTREPTPNGIKAGNFFSAEFAKQGFNIVSGLALAVIPQDMKEPCRLEVQLPPFWPMGWTGTLFIQRRTLNWQKE
jgi:DNA processing protein